MQETLGEVGSDVSNPEFLDLDRASRGIIEIFIGPENPRAATGRFSLPGLTGGLWKVMAEAALGRNFMILNFGLDCLSIISLQIEILPNVIIYIYIYINEMS